MKVRLGLEIGDHQPSYDTFLDYISSHYDLDTLGFVLIYISPEEVGAERFYEWARFFKEHDIQFAFLYTQQRGAPKGRVSHLTREIVAGIREIAGDYFLGDMIGETGGLASWPRGYYGHGEALPRQDFADLQEAKDNYVEEVAQLVKVDRERDVEHVLAVEATTFSRYNFEAGVDYTFLEMMCGDPVLLLSSARGASRAYGREYWGCHIAHEWYGGFRQDDLLKYKRLKLAYGYAYLAGAGLIYPESGDYGMHSYGYSLPPESEFCQAHRDAWNEFSEFLKTDERPDCGPTVKVAFVQGNLDSFAGWGGTTVWNQFGSEAWGYAAPERSWDILREANRSQSWHETTVFGEYDDTAAPAYGLYDVLPIEAPAEVMAQYDVLILTGWNTMTEEIAASLKAYVAGGGVLLTSAAHWNTSAKREGELTLLNDGKLAEFLGCDLSPDGVSLNSGVKFYKESLIPGVLYPATGDLDCDPICAAGFARYAGVKLAGGEVKATLCDTFMGLGDRAHPALIENRYGKGVVATMTNLDYPGSAGVYPFYRILVKALLAAGARNCPVRVLASDRVNFAVYGDTVYLQNSDYNVSAPAIVCKNGEKRVVMLDPCELKRVNF